MKMSQMTFQMKINPKQASEAILDIFDDIGEYSSWSGEIRGFGENKLAAFLAEHEEVETIKVRINSNGGDVFAGVSVLNILRASGKTVDVEIVGIAASIASVIAMAGDTIRMHPTSMMMIHNCWTFACGNANEFRKLADDMDKITSSSKTAYLNQAGDKLDEETLKSLLDNETYLTADECFKYGLCTEVIGKEVTEDEADPEPNQDEMQKEESETKKIEQKIEELEKVKNYEPVQKKVSWFF